MEDVAAKHYIRILRDMVHTNFVVKNVGVLWTKNTHIRGMAGKFVDTSAIRKSNALLKKRFA